MRIFSLLVLCCASLLSGAFVAGCGDDEKSTATSPPSSEGESCGRSADCATGLVCVGSYCVKSAGAAGAGGSGALGPLLGREGESCGRRSDCDGNLLCIQERCVSNGAGEGGAGGNSVQPRLGAQGESCRTVSDCAMGLTCKPVNGFGSPICDSLATGLEPSGKMCGGECLTPEDCCQIPTILNLGSCNDLKTSIGDITKCASPDVSIEAACFQYKTYCECAAGTWTCDNNLCSYASKCTTNGDTNAGCAAYSRLNRGLSSICDKESGQCKLTGCKTASDCLATTDEGQPCSKDECICLEGGCYRPCNEDLDCTSGQACDKAKRVCVRGAECTSNTQCALNHRNVREECREGKCVLPCTGDTECEQSVIVFREIDGPNTLVCGKKGICEPLGCTNHAECGSSTRTFCVTPAPLSAYHSAITD